MKNYISAGEKLGELIDSKQQQYGDSFSKSNEVLKVLYPDGILPHQYGDVMTIVRVIDKLFRIAQRGEDNEDLGGESPWKDIAGYGLLGAVRDEDL